MHSWIFLQTIVQKSLKLIDLTIIIQIEESVKYPIQVLVKCKLDIGRWTFHGLLQLKIQGVPINGLFMDCCSLIQGVPINRLFMYCCSLIQGVPINGLFILLQLHTGCTNKWTLHGLLQPDTGCTNKWTFSELLQPDTWCTNR